jgi:predicted NUDIX family phosphoesterase
VCSETQKIIVSAMTSTCPTARLITVTSMGVGSSMNEVGFLRRLMMKLILGRVLADKEVQEDITRAAASLKWVIVRPGGLTNETMKSNGKYKLGPHTGGMVSRVDVAEVLAKLAENEDGLWDKWERQPISVAY